MNAPPRAHMRALPLALVLFACFSPAYLLSYAYRVVNSVIGADLSAELGLSGSDVGLLTATYFLSFALLQLPLGVWLDRYEARRVEAALLLLAAIGALVFALGTSLWALMAGRLLIGAGVSACLMASFRAYSSWLPAATQVQLNLWMLVVGSSGALLVTRPAEAMVAVTGWRGLFLLLAGLTLVAATLLWFVVPRPQPGLAPRRWGQMAHDLVRILRGLPFWRLAPLAIVQHGGFLAIQGLWLGLWFAEVHGLPRAAVAQALFGYNLAILIAFFLLGLLVPRLAALGIRQDRVYEGGLALAQMLMLAILVLPGVDSVGAWIAVGVLTTVAQLSYTMLGQSVPVELTGRTSVSLNLSVFVGAFCLQWAIGVGVDAMRAGGAETAQAYRAALGGLLALQTGAFAFYVWATRRLARRGSGA